MRSEYSFSRREQDDFAVRSHLRARQAIADGVFEREIVPVEVAVKGKTSVVADDEAPSKFDEAKLRALQAGVRSRRHDHGGKRVEHQRRRSRFARGIARRVRTH